MVNSVDFIIVVHFHSQGTHSGLAPSLPELPHLLRISDIAITENNIHLTHNAVYPTRGDHILGIDEAMVPEVRLIVWAGRDAGSAAAAILGPEQETLLGVAMELVNSTEIIPGIFFVVRVGGIETRLVIKADGFGGA